MLPEIEFKVCGLGNNPESYKACESFVKEWQKKLNIQDWEIRLEFLSANEVAKNMDSDEYNAFCTRTISSKYAVISINCESPQINDALETTLLHELLHIVFDEYQTFSEAAIKDNDYALSMVKMKMEQTIESLAKTLTNFIKDDSPVK